MNNAGIIKSVVNLSTLAVLLLVLLMQSSCRVGYSFTGASVSPLVKTITIHNLPNNASYVWPTLSRNLTQAIKDYFTTQTSLILVERNGDLDLDGSITGYTITPTAIQGNETAAMNRLTITVHMKFVNKINEKQNFETDFSKYLDYNSTPEPSPGQMDTYIATINEQLVQEIFNKSFANW
ncbi:MAG TPA: LptE family protein [Bacteroidales bacterium]|nr:LptE family protein [Bacteroidales bacterium]